MLLFSLFFHLYKASLELVMVSFGKPLLKKCLYFICILITYHQSCTVL